MKHRILEFLGEQSTTLFMDRKTPSTNINLEKVLQHNRESFVSNLLSKSLLISPELFCDYLNFEYYIEVYIEGAKSRKMIEENRMTIQSGDPGTKHLSAEYY